MPRYIRTDKLQDTIFIPFTLSAQIMPGTLASTIEYMVDRKIDMSAFERKAISPGDPRTIHACCSS